MAVTVLGSHISLIWQQLEEEGLDVRKLFAEADLDPNVLADGNGRFALASVQNLWHLAEQHSQSTCLGLDVGRRWSPKYFHALGFAWLSSATVFDALARLQRYSRLLSDNLNCQVSVQGDICKLTITEVYPDIEYADSAIVAGATVLVTMLRELLGPNYNPIRVDLDLPRGSNSLYLEQFLRCPVYYQSDFAVHLSLADCERPLMGASMELLRANEEIAEAYLARMEKTDLRTRVEAELVARLPSGQVTEELLAIEMGLSLRTMQRQLQQQGTSFGMVLQDVRQHLAKNYVSDTSLSLTEIAYLLGFSDPANFSRAFRRWFDMSPSEYRKRELKLAV